MDDDSDRETHTTRVFFASRLFSLVILFVRPRESPRKPATTPRDIEPSLGIYRVGLVGETETHTKRDSGSGNQPNLRGATSARRAPKRLSEGVFVISPRRLARAPRVPQSTRRPPHRDTARKRDSRQGVSLALIPRRSSAVARSGARARDRRREAKAPLRGPPVRVFRVRPERARPARRCPR